MRPRQPPLVTIEPTDDTAARQAELDRIETQDARLMLAQIAKPGSDEIERLLTAKRWLKKHWSDGWTAAGGPSGAPEEPPAKPKKANKS